MSSGDTLFILNPQGSCGPSANFATHDEVVDISTPPILIPVLDFDGGADEHADWIVTIPSSYAGATGFTFSYKSAMDSTDGAVVEMEFRVLPIPDQTVLSGDLGMDTQTEVTITDDPDATADDFNYSATGTLAKAAFGSVGAGTLICIRATRDIDGEGPNADDLQLAEILVTET